MLKDREIIEALNITKKYGDKLILDNLNLKIHKGEVIGIVGKNGSGKSTFLRILMKMSKPTSGSIKIDKDIKISYIPENFSKLELTVEEYLSSMAQIDGLKKEEYRKIIDELYEKFGLVSMNNTKMKHLSKGTLQKVAIVQAFIVKPDILFLDEPLSGQDIESQNMFISILKEFISDNVTIVLSCHEIELINELATRIIRIEDKKLLEIKKDDEYTYCDNYAIMEFLRKDIGQETISTILECGGYSVDEDKIVLEIKENQSQRILSMMIEEDYKLLKYYIKE